MSELPPQDQPAATHGHKTEAIAVAATMFLAIGGIAGKRLLDKHRALLGSIESAETQLRSGENPDDPSDNS